MTSHNGKFVWYEMLSDDPAAAQTFYHKVLGWTGQDSGVPGVQYTMLMAGQIPVAGLMAMPEEARKMGARPSWTGYVAVADADAKAAEVKKLGGAVHREPFDIPNVGRIAIVADPDGSAFALFQNTCEGEAPAVEPGTAGHVGWRELYAADLDKAFAFYAGLFGWTKSQAVDMGPMGVYQLFAVDGVDAGGMMKKPEQSPIAGWGYYFNVTGIDAAAERVRAAGGQVVNGPMEVPGGHWIAQCLDPQGIYFAVVSLTR